MAKECDMSLYQDVLEPFRQLINTDPPGAESSQSSASATMSLTEGNPTKRGLPNLLSLAKRKTSFGSMNATLVKKPRTEPSSRTAPVSQWEIKKMKMDLISAKAEITLLEARVNHQHTLRKEMQILFDEEKVSLIDQHKRDERAVRDMEDRLNVMKRREKEVTEDLSQALKEHNGYKAKWDAEKSKLQKQIADLKDQMLEHSVSNRDEIAEMKKDMDELCQGLEGAQSEVEMLKAELARQTSRAEQCTSLRTQVEKLSFELLQANNKLQELQYEKDSFQDWQQHSKTAQNRLTNMASLEIEVARLRASERSLRESAGNNLLLEEKVDQLTAQLEALQPAYKELCEAKVKLSALETTLSELDSAARAHGVQSASELTTALESALNEHLTAVASLSQTQSQLAQLTEEMATLKYERDKATATSNDLQTVRNTQDGLIQRLQKRLLLFTRERDNYKQQLDCYEKEMASELTDSDSAGPGPSGLLRARVEQLEHSLQSYRDLLALTDQTAHTTQLESLRADVTRWRDLAEQARRDATKLRAQRDHLQQQLERIIAQDPRSQVIHIAEDPAALAYRQLQGDLEAANDEIRSLKVALQTSSLRVCPEEFKQLKQQLESCQIKLQGMRDDYHASALEYREVCYMLLGYRLERIAPKNYRILSVYADSDDEYLAFNICDGGIELVQTDYSATLEELVEMHLQQQRSIPLFLSALTMQLFFRSTAMPQDME